MRRRRPGAAALDRARGALLGLAVGDALGAPLQWLHPEQIDARYGGPLRDMVASTVWERGEWTDDTAMAVALAESLAECGRYDEDDVLARYVVWARGAPKDIGVTIEHALRRARTAAEARAAAARFHEESGGRSAGNGALMRTAPIALRFRDDPGALERVSRADAALTHHDPLAGDACAFFNLTLAALVAGRRPPVSTSPVGVAARTAPELADEQLLAHVHGEIGYVLTALRVGFAAALRHASFEQAIVFAINLGGDADTNGAVAGALAGARFGMRGIPERFVEPLRDHERIVALAGRLMRA